MPKTREVYKNAGLDISTFGENECNLIEKDLQDYTSEYRTQTNFKDEFFEILLKVGLKMQMNIIMLNIK